MCCSDAEFVLVKPQPSPLVQPSPSPAPPNEDCDGPSPDYIKCCWKIDACVKIWVPILAAVIGLPAALVAIKALCPSYWPFGERPHQVPHTVPHTDLPDGLPSCRESVDHREAHVSVAVNMGKCCFIGRACDVGSGPSS